ncbi:MAG: squalene synthase HpnD [Rhodospirillales bacterium]|nr:squalene synthase HpnD [Rhodospirillales bacterium]
MTAEPGSPSKAEAMVHVADVVKRSGTSFFWGMRCLPEEKRSAMYAVYAFCREVDDIADDPGAEEEKLFRLGQWRGEIERLYADRPRAPISVALADPVERFALRKEDFRAVVAGMEMDARASVRIADMAELHLYCDRVACAVGRHSVRIFGIDGEKGDLLAAALGQAFQLTNILRDLSEDAARDRLYLPQDVLTAHGIAESDPQGVLGHPALPQVCDLVAAIASRRFAEAVTILRQCKREQVRPAVLMMEMYRRIFRDLTRRGWTNNGERVRLSKLEKLWVILRHGVI